MALWPDTQEWYRGVATKIYKLHREWATRATNEFYFDVEFDDGDVRAEIPDHEIISLKFYKRNPGEDDEEEEEGGADREEEGVDREEEREGRPSSDPGRLSATMAKQGTTSKDQDDSNQDEEGDSEDDAVGKPSSGPETTNTTLTNRGTTINNEIEFVIQPISEPPKKGAAKTTQNGVSTTWHEAIVSPNRRPTPPAVSTPMSPQCIEYKI